MTGLLRSPGLSLREAKTHAAQLANTAFIPGDTATDIQEIIIKLAKKNMFFNCFHWMCVLKAPCFSQLRCSYSFTKHLLTTNAMETFRLVFMIWHRLD